MKTIPTSQLRPGHVIGAGIGRVLITEPLKLSQSHQPEHGGVRYTTARVLDVDAATSVVPRSWLQNDGHDGPTWLVQGNDLRRWTVYAEPTA